jgi:hypothetical protein
LKQLSALPSADTATRVAAVVFFREHHTAYFVYIYGKFLRPPFDVHLKSGK